MISLLRPLGLALLTLGCGGAETSFSSSWIEWSDGPLTVQLPREPDVEPKEIDTKIGTISMRLAMVYLGDDRGLALTQTTFPLDPADFDATGELAGSVRAIRNRNPGEEESTVDVEHRGLPGQEIVIALAEEPVMLRARLYVDPDGPSLYMLQARGPEAFTRSPEVEHFFDSMRIEPVK